MCSGRSPPRTGGGDIVALRVLVAEDNVVNQMVARLMLVKLGHEVTTVGDGVAAVEAAQQGRFDVVLMDVQMPVLGGLEATARIRAELPSESQPRIVALSASVLAEDRSATVEAGMDDFLSKPLRLQELDAVLSRGAQPPAQVAATLIEAIWDRLDELGGHDQLEDRMLFSQLLRSLAGRAPMALHDIALAVGHHHSADVNEQVHSLRGSVANLGGNELAALLYEIERRSLLDQPVDPASLQPVRRELTQFCCALLAVADELDQDIARDIAADGAVG